MNIAAILHEPAVGQAGKAAFDVLDRAASASYCRNGFVRRSRPIVVGSP